MKRRLLAMLSMGCALVVLLVSAAALGAVVLLFRTLPPMDGSLAVAGLREPVEIRFDDHQRPFVTAQTLEDALFAEGWLHATHRLWQMEMFRRAATGRLSELLGPSMLDTDRELWRIGVPQLARQLERNASRSLAQRVGAYVAGVNAAIAGMELAPPEFLLLRATPAPWTPSDVYAMGALMAFQSANNMENELLRLALLNELGEERSAIFLPDDGNVTDFPYVLSRSASLPGIVRALDRLAQVDPLDAPWFPSFAFGSNGWVVAPEKSATGNALFAFDSHDSLGIPNLFYEVHLFFENGRQIRGWSVAGLPGVINGYNERIAWGFTNIGDSQDLFLETRSDADPLRFKEGSDWYSATTETVEINVRGREAPENLTLVYTRNGTLISDDPPIALRWTVQELNGLGLDSLLDLNLAQNWQEFTAALDRFAAPPLNATYADLDGNIGFRTAGLLPRRGRGEGLVPLAGDDPANRWQGYVDMAELPERANPPEGFLAAANARVNASGDGPLISADNAPGYRIRRIRSVLVDKASISADDMRTLQADWHDTQAEMLLPALLAAVSGAVLDETERAAVDAVRSWQADPEARPDLAAPLIFQAWYKALAYAVFEPALSAEVFAQLARSNYPLNHALDRLVLRDLDSEWWRGDRETIIGDALRVAVAEIRAVQGNDPATWRLDAMHRVKLEHELANAVPPLGVILNIAPAPWGGSTSTVGRARYRYDRAYDVTGAATMRVVGEMADTIHMRAVMPTGQSGHPLSPAYSDQHNAWLEGELIPIADRAEDVGEVRLRLTPAE